MVNKKSKVNLYVLDADPEIKKLKSKIEQIAYKALSVILTKIAFSEQVDVVVYRYKAPNKDFSVSGYTPTGNTVWIYADPAQKNFANLIKIQLPRVLSHELHHAARTQGPGFGETLEETLVTEGLAGHFEIELFGGKPSHFYTKFSEKELEKYYLKAKQILKSKNFSYDEWFLGANEKKLPKHIGYALGYWLIGGIKDLRPSKLYKVKAREITKYMFGGV